MDPKVQQLILIACAISGVIIAGAGLFTWRAQLRGQVEHKLIQRILIATLRCRDSISGARTPFTSYSPKDIDPKGTLTKEEFDHKAMRLELDRRWKLILSSRAELDAALIEFEALYGEDSLKSFKEVRSIESDIYYAFLQRVDKSDPTMECAFSLDELKSMNDTIYGGQRKNDQMTKRLSEAILKITQEFRPKLKPSIFG